MTAESYVNKKVKAILIGVTDYSDIPDTPDLPAGKNDTALMASALVTGLCVSPFHIWLKRRNAGCITRADFLEGIRIFLSDIAPDDLVIFYFSGHGVLLPEGHSLLFSDGPLLTQSVIDLFEELQAKKRILLLDCCMSGAHQLSAAEPMGEEQWMEELLEKGTIIFSSSRSVEKSGYLRQGSASLFTSFLWNAMTNRFYIREGKLSMDRIRELVFREAAAWNEAYPDRAQHPVFRSNMGGTVYFPVMEYHPYQKQQYFADLENCRIVSVNPLHSQINKRYAVKVILKHAVTREQLCRYNHVIIRAVQPLEIFSSVKQERQWKGKPLDLVFTYFGYSREDIASGNHAFYTTWARLPQDRNKWYRENRNAEVVDDILVNTNRYYPLCRQLTEKNTADDRTVFHRTESVMRRMINLGETVLRDCREYRNGETAGTELFGKLRPILHEIDRCYLELTDLPVPSAELTKWSLLCANAAGDVQDFSVILSGWQRNFSEKKNAEQDPDKERQWPALDEAEARFHEDLEILRKEEEKIQASP